MKILICISVFASLALVSVTAERLVIEQDVFEVEWSEFQLNGERAFNFTVKAQTVGWVALALTTNPGGADMKGYDIALGGVRNGVGYLYDLWSDREVKPTLDDHNQLTLNESREEVGWTTLRFFRPAITNDAKDVQIQADTHVYLAWAIGQSDARSGTDFDKHNDKGHTKIAYNLITGATQLPPTSKPVTTASARVNGALTGLIVLGLLVVKVYLR